MFKVNQEVYNLKNELCKIIEINNGYYKVKLNKDEIKYYYQFELSETPNKKMGKRVEELFKRNKVWENYKITKTESHLEYFIKGYYSKQFKLNLNDKKWSKKEEIKYIEELLLNKNEVELVMLGNEVLDGSQAVLAIDKFLQNELSIFDNIKFKNLCREDLAFFYTLIVSEINIKPIKENVEPNELDKKEILKEENLKAFVDKLYLEQLKKRFIF